MNTYTCCICLQTFTSREVVLPTLVGCPDAPVICERCRAHPEALDIARQLLKRHLDEHHDRGDFNKLFTPSWRDPWRTSGVLLRGEA